MMKPAENLLIGAVAEACGVSVDTIRHYERKGVISGVAFTLDELARIFRQRESGAAPCRNVHALAVRKLQELDERIEMLGQLRQLLADETAFILRVDPYTMRQIRRNQKTFAGQTRLQLKH